MNRYYLILEAVAGTLFGYSMYTHLSSVDTLATLRHTAIPSAIVGGLFVLTLTCDDDQIDATQQDTNASRIHSHPGWLHFIYAYLTPCATLVRS